MHTDERTLLSYALDKDHLQPTSQPYDDHNVYGSDGQMPNTEIVNCITSIQKRSVEASTIFGAEAAAHFCEW